MNKERNIPHKASRVLSVILLAFIFIFLRVWYLSCIQGDLHRQKSLKPRHRVLVDKATRATIRDRFNIPLAENKLHYAVTVCYAEIRDLPSFRMEIDAFGNKQKVAVRSAYVTALAQFLAKELHLDAQHIEDLLHAKAALFPHTPFVIKDALQEKEYYRMRAAEKDWIGLKAARTSTRVYPKGKVACDVIGYMGAISSLEYTRIAQEIEQLEHYLHQREMGESPFLPEGYDDPWQVRKRLALLQDKSYTVHDLVGKSGIEQRFDEMLRGSHGKKYVEIDPKGHVLEILPGSHPPIDGERVFVTLSAELQEYAESLLAQHEAIRDEIPDTPWIKGGSIIAMDPKTGEILTLASYPRFDPNDFIPSKNPEIYAQKQQYLHHWLEDETYVQDLWNGTTPLTKEYFSQKSGWFTKEISFSWEYFTDHILAASHTKQTLQRIDTLQKAQTLHRHFSHLLHHTGNPEPTALIQALYPHAPLSKQIDADTLVFLQDTIQGIFTIVEEDLSVIHTYLKDIAHNDDKLLILDITRLFVLDEPLSAKILNQLPQISLSSFFACMQSAAQLRDAIRVHVKTLHHHLGFQPWRTEHFPSFLRHMRKQEREQHKQTTPFTDYLEKVENTLYKRFWSSCQDLFLDSIIHQTLRHSLTSYPELIPYIEHLAKASFAQEHIHRLRTLLAPLSPDDAIDVLKHLRSFSDLKRPLYGTYRTLRNTKGKQTEKHLAASFYSTAGYGRAPSFRQSTPLGSVFKLVVAYEALKERYEHLNHMHESFSHLNPLTLIDQLQSNASDGSQKQILGYTIDGQPIRRLYKGGLLPRGRKNAGKIHLTEAIEQSSNLYFSLLAAEHIADPSYLEQATREFGFGSLTGIALQGETKGHIPDDLAENKTGLYAFAIGQHSLTVTPLQTAVMLSALGNRGHILRPKIVHLLAGKTKNLQPAYPPTNLDHYPFQESLALIGIHFPLFTEALQEPSLPRVQETAAETLRSLFFPDEIRSLLLTSMDLVLTGKKGSARPALISSLRQSPQELQDYISLQHELIGKTGTAEILYKQDLTREMPAKMHNHIWFGGLVFPGKFSFHHEDAELAIVIYLRFSEAGGKEAAPLAAKIAKKWREIQIRHNMSP